MKGLFCMLVSTGMLYACQLSNSAHSGDMSDVDDSITTEFVPTDENLPTEAALPAKEVVMPAISNPPDSIVEGFVLMPVSYRVFEGDKVSETINARWRQLHKVRGQYRVSPAAYTIHWEDEEPCSGLPTETIIPKQRETSLFFDIASIRNGNIDTVAFEQKIIAPGTSFDFSYKNSTYTLKAFGRPFYQNDDQDRTDSYILQLFVDGEYVKTLIQQNEYNDTATQLEFIGDLDGDGVLDFILESPRHYEEFRTIIILSGTAHDYEGIMVFDC